MNVELDEELEGAEAHGDDDEASLTTSVRRSARVVDRNERGSQRRIAKGLEAEIEGMDYDPGGPRRYVAVVIPDKPPRPLSEYQAMKVTYH